MTTDSRSFLLLLTVISLTKAKAKAKKNTIEKEKIFGLFITDDNISLFSISTVPFFSFSLSSHIQISFGIRT